MTLAAQGVCIFLVGLVIFFAFFYFMHLLDFKKNIGPIRNIYFMPDMTIRVLFRQLLGQTNLTEDEYIGLVKQKIDGRLLKKHSRLRLMNGLISGWKCRRLKALLGNTRLRWFILKITWEEIQDAISCLSENATTDYVSIVCKYKPREGHSLILRYLIQDFFEKLHLSGAVLFVSKTKLLKWLAIFVVPSQPSQSEYATGTAGAARIIDHLEVAEKHELRILLVTMDKLLSNLENIAA